MSLLQRWGLGVQLVFEAGSAIVQMSRTTRAATSMRASFQDIKGAVAGAAGELGKVGAVLAPLGAAFALMVGHGSRLAADLEAQKLTMRVMLGDAAKAEALIGMIRKEAAATPFEEGDLIEGSKRLLRLTGQNVDANMDLLRLVETMTALNPTKSITDSVEAVLDATSGGGFERLKEFGLAFRAEDFAAAGRPGGKAWADAVVAGIKGEMGKLTNGENIVGALSQTFQGRLSTLKDAFNGIARSIGEAFNQAVGPMLGPLTDKIAALTPAFVGATHRLIGIVADMGRRMAPVFGKLEAWWAGLGEEGQDTVIMVAMGVGALAAALVPLGAVVGAVAVAISGVVGAVSALAPVVGAVLAPEVLLPMAAALAYVAGAASLLFAVFRKEGEGPLDFLGRLAGAVQSTLIDLWNSAQRAFSGFVQGFTAGFGGFGGLVERVGPPMRELWARVQDLWAFFAGRNVSPGVWVMLGQAIAWLANKGITALTAGLQSSIALVDVLFTVLEPFALAIGAIIDGIVSLVTGTKTAGDAFDTMMGGIGMLLGAFIVGAINLLVGAMELIIRQVLTLLATIPGMKDAMDATGNFGADALGRFRQGFADNLLEGMAGINLADNRRNQEAANAASPTVNVAAPEVKADVKVDTSVQVDGREIARAGGAEAVRSARKTGAALPATQRGRVLRGNGTVNALRPGEVL